MDTRKNKWVPRRNVSAPKTINEIRKEAARELAQKQESDRRARQEHRSSGNHRGSQSGGNDRRGAPPSGWNRVGQDSGGRGGRDRGRGQSGSTGTDFKQFGKGMNQPIDAKTVTLGPPGMKWGAGARVAGSDMQRTGSGSSNKSTGSLNLFR